MFNRTGYDRSFYDRSADFDNIEANLRGNSKLTTNVTVQVYLGSFTLTGIGGLKGSPTMLRAMQINFSGEGSLAINNLTLRLRLPTSMSGAGVLNAKGIGVRVPFGVEFSGSSSMKDSLTYFLQHVTGRLTGSGAMSLPLTIRVFLESLLNGFGAISADNKFKLEMPLASKFSGAGEFIFRRIGALNSDTLEFEDINLQPGQSLTIDSEELNIFIDNTLDVSSLTSDSVFFQLQPGENEITFISEENPDLEVTIIWQNRWL